MCAAPIFASHQFDACHRCLKSRRSCIRMSGPAPCVQNFTSFQAKVTNISKASLLSPPRTHRQSKVPENTLRPSPPQSAILQDAHCESLLSRRSQPHVQHLLGRRSTARCRLTSSAHRCSCQLATLPADIASATEWHPRWRAACTHHRQGSCARQLISRNCGTPPSHCDCDLVDAPCVMAAARPHGPVRFGSCHKLQS
jgi:hypothetical protein